jgi:hypothetical protein
MIWLTRPSVFGLSSHNHCIETNGFERNIDCAPPSVSAWQPTATSPTAPRRAPVITREAEESRFRTVRQGRDR